MKDPVKLQIHNLEDDRIWIHNTIFEREALETWIKHSVEVMGSKYHKWEIVEI